MKIKPFRKCPFVKGDKVKLADDSLQQHSRSVPAHMGYTREQFQYRDFLNKVMGQTGTIYKVWSSGNVDVIFGKEMVLVDYEMLVPAIKKNPAENYRIEYDSDKNVIDFLRSNGFVLSISKPVTVYGKWGDNKPRNKYMITWRSLNHTRKLSYAFFDSIHNYEQGLLPNISSVVTPEIHGDEPMDYEEFLSAFGYEDDKETRKIYKSWSNLVNKAMNFFSEEQREELREMEL